MCFGHPSQLLNYFYWESLPGHSNRTVESKPLRKDWIIKFWIQQSVLSYIDLQNHARMFTGFPFFVGFGYHVWNLGLKPRFHICDIAVSTCFGHPSHLVTYFSWESLPGHSNQIRQLNPECYDPDHLHSYQSLHREVHFVTFGNHIRSHVYGITSVHLHVFHFLSDLHNT